MAKKSSINPSNETVFSIQINKNVDIDIKFLSDASPSRLRHSIFIFHEMHVYS